MYETAICCRKEKEKRAFEKKTFDISDWCQQCFLCTFKKDKEEIPEL